ncbi:MAG: AsmA family protein [Oxalobacteraceae bacterium]|nr:AsmA family protein [Oxalobacteraceae bacterium]
MKMPRRRKIALGVGVALIAVPAVALVALLNFDWNRAKPWLNARTSEALGRPFSIAGDLSLTWEKQAAGLADLDQGWRGMIPWPHLIAQDVHIGNPPAVTATTDTSAAEVAPLPTEMARIRQFAFALNPLALLDKRIVIPVLRFDSPVVRLLRGADGKNNWTFKNDDKQSPWQLELQRVVFTKGSVHLTDAIRHADVTAAVDTIDADPNYGVAWQIRGKFNGENVSGNGKAGAVLSLQHQTEPYPIMAHLRIGQTVIAADGTLTKPTDLAALDMRLKMSGVSMARLYALTGVVLPETPPFATEGHLSGTLSPHGSHWTYEKFSGKVGSSDIGGSLDYRSKQPRALLSGTVVSRVLRFSDLAPLIGADSNASKARRGADALQPTNKVLPVESFKTERWTSVDADIKFSAEKILREKELPINKLTTNLHLQDGVLSLLPLNFDMAGGSLSSNITLDGSGTAGKNAIKATMKVTARHLKLKQLFPTLQPLQTSIGEINGDASLSAQGNSVASLLGASNGEIKTLINQGTVSKLLLEQMGLNIANVILTRLFGDKQVKLNCMATDFGVTNGLMQSRSFIVDTDDAILGVSGNINLAQEQLDLTIRPNSKGLRVFSLRAPLYVRGSFKQPRVSVDKGVLAMRAGGAIALAALAPVAALIPLINAGPGEDSECAKLLADVRVKPMAPPPGKTYRSKVKPRAR